MRNFFLCIFLFPIACIAQLNTGYVPVDEFKLFYKIFGDSGKPILIINGGPGFSSNYLDEFAKEMSADMNRKVILYDPRGTGKSIVKPISKRTVNIRNSITDIEELRKHLGIQKWDIIGHAYGGGVAMMYAKNYGKTINHLVLSSSIGMNLDFVKPMLSNLKVRLSLEQLNQLGNLVQQQKEGKLSSSQFYKQRFDLLAEAYVFDQRKVEKARAMITLETDFSLEINMLLWNELNRQGYSMDKYMKDFKQPVLILHGRQDVIGESVPLYSHSIFPNSQIYFLNDAGRYLWLDQPKAYFNYLEDFLM